MPEPSVPAAPGRALSRRRFLAAAGGGLTVCLGGGIYARMIEPTWLRLRHLTVPVPNLLRPVTITHLSDLHLSDVVPLSYLESAIRAAEATGPDLFCITGDFITHRVRQRDDYARILARLPRTAPTVAVTGNHDGGAWALDRGGYPDPEVIHALLRDAGIRVLDNRAHQLSIGGRPIHLVGVGDPWSERLAPDAAFAALPSGAAPRILLSHNPDSKSELAPYPWDLMLCGHTHGGQIRLPVFGTPFAPVQDHSIVHGLHRWRDRWIHVTAGIGNLHGIRFNCRPEIAVLTLVPKAAPAV